MVNIKEIQFTQHVYGVAAKYLWVIGSHPAHVEKGHIGYFMTIENIEEVIKTLNPEDWYKDESYEEKKSSFSDLPTEDQWKVTEAINYLKEKSMSQSHLEEKCGKCLRLSLEFGDKILNLLHEKGKLKKV